MMKMNLDKPIILFDGVCNLCNASVQFIIKRDSKKKFMFSSLQSDAAQAILLHNYLENLDFDTIILLEDGNVYDKSTAILKIIRRLSGFYRLGYMFIVVPKFIRDFVYQVIANNRYKWFGKRDTCMLPTEELKLRFLE